VEFKRVFDAGHRGQGRFMTLLVAPNQTNAPRLGIVASRKLGGSVQRNRAKRLIREIFRLTTPAETPAVDVVVIPRRALLDAAYVALEEDHLTTLRRSVARLARAGA
jgi:ribonuclease P protein component